MSSVNEIMKMFDVDRVTALQIFNLVKERDEQVDPYDLQFLPPSYSSSTNSYNGGSTTTSRGGLAFLKKVMPWPFLFINK